MTGTLSVEIVRETQPVFAADMVRAVGPIEEVAAE